MVSMMQALKKYKAWQSRRKVRALIQWERTRAKGKARFVWEWAWKYWLIIIPLMAYTRYFSEGAMQSWQSARFWTDGVRYLLSGAFMSWLNWGFMEFEYNKVRLGYSTIPPDLLAPPPNQSTSFTQH